MQTINVPLVVGLASGFAFVNLVLGLTWFLCRRSNIRRAKRRREQELASNRSLEKSPPFLKLNYGEMPPDVEVRVALSHTEKRDRYTPPKPSNRRRQAERLEEKKAPPGLSGLRNQLTVPSIISRGTSGDSSETASMYSTASAPIDLHDQILLSQPFPRTLHTSNNNNTTVTTLRSSAHILAHVAEDSLPSPIRPLLSASPTSQIFGDELLAPEMYDKTLPYHRSGLNQSESLPSSLLKPAGSSRPRSQWSLSHTSSKKADSLLPLHLKPMLMKPSPMAGQKSSTIGRQEPWWIASPYSPPPAQG